MIAASEPSDANSGDEGPCWVSPDGKLALTVTKDVDDEQLIGFHGFDWSVQASVLSELGNCSAEEAIQRFIEDVIQDRSIISMLRTGDCLSDVWITDDPKMDQSYIKQGESISFRYWSGKSATPTQ